ncbi:hypothetical protein OOZ63_00975 [Paucibacter sp. PLA-PC-4]|nr:hypothetical protein [Paucibacter sp. PLA-PC-4]MCX2860411.1 hypothetical protein [Paucibacter sp. PLA-PC-4]
MFCSRFIAFHLLRGAAATALLLGAVLLMRGCPMCRPLGLFETVRRRFRA